MNHADEDFAFACPAFASEQELDAYVESIQPHRELVCPITQELMRDAVVAEDGYTYEREAILRWFSVGKTRSPVTNELIGGQNVMFPNRAVQSLALAHCEKLGQELLNRCHFIKNHQGSCEDNGSRIAALLDAGADISLRCRDDDNSTALLLLIKSRNLSLCRLLLQHDAPVHFENDAEKKCIETVEQIIKSMEKSTNAQQKEDWRLFLDEIRWKATQEATRKEERENARNHANEMRREHQRDLAIQHRVNQRGGATAVGVGDLEDGWGYFPSLVTLQFQGSIPPPSQSVAPVEQKERERLRRLLQLITFLVFLVLLIV